MSAKERVTSVKQRGAFLVHRVTEGDTLVAQWRALLPLDTSKYITEAGEVNMPALRGDLDFKAIGKLDWYEKRSGSTWQDVNVFSKTPDPTYVRLSRMENLSGLNYLMPPVLQAAYITTHQETILETIASEEYEYTVFNVTNPFKFVPGNRTIQKPQDLIRPYRLMATDTAISTSMARSGYEHMLVQPEIALALYMYFVGTRLYLEELFEGQEKIKKKLGAVVDQWDLNHNVADRFAALTPFALETLGEVEVAQENAARFFEVLMDTVVQADAFHASHQYENDEGEEVRLRTICLARDHIKHATDLDPATEQSLLSNLFAWIQSNPTLTQPVLTRIREEFRRAL